MAKTTDFKKVDEASPPRILEERGGPPRLLWRAALIFAATLAAYFPALKAGFIWNDSDYVTAPALRSLAGLGRIWFDVGATEQYYPLLHSAFWVEHRLWGDAAMGYHLVNILLHAASACLLLMVLGKLKVGRVALNPPVGLSGQTSVLGATRSTFFNAPVLAAFLFALHPIYVESVAWISEQKNTLSTVFYLLAMLVYLNFDETKSNPLAAESAKSAEKDNSSSSLRSLRSLRLKIWGSYFLSLALFILALLSKTVTATLPGALLVILWWQRGRLAWKRDVLPLIPWFGLGAGSGLFSAWVERTYVGAQGSGFGLNALERCLLAGRAVWFYLGRLIWPADLIFIYPRWTVNGAAWGQYLYPVAVVALVAALWLIRQRTRGPLAAVLFFLGSLFPVSGFFNLYAFIYSYVADHWQYLPSIGILVLVAAGWEKGKLKVESWKLKGIPPSNFQLSTYNFWRVAPFTIVAILGVLTFRQSGMYNDIETFYRRTISKNPACWMAHTNLAIILAASGRPEEAMAHYEQALQFNPDRPEVIHNDLGRVLLDSGRVPEAMAQFEEALRLNDGYFQAHFNLGTVFFQEGRLDDAIVQFGDALRTNADDPAAHNDLGVVLAATGRSAEAIAQFDEAIRFDPNFAEPHFNRGLALLRQRRLPEAKAEFEQALRIKPDYAAPRDKLLQLQNLSQ